MGLVQPSWIRVCLSSAVTVVRASTLLRDCCSYVLSLDASNCKYPFLIGLFVLFARVCQIICSTLCSRSTVKADDWCVETALKYVITNNDSNTTTSNC